VGEERVGPRQTKPTGYLPSLDGWRAVAILGVLAVHEVPIAIGGRSLQTLQSFGSLGVVLFFAISGVLICSRICEEEALTGRFHLRSFYVRRLCRIQPAAMVYLATVAVLTLVGVLHEQWRYWFGGLFLYQNFLYHEDSVTAARTFFTGHFWTLAVEEHFYLLISLALFFIKKRRLMVFAIALVAVKLGQEIGMHYTAEPQLRRTYWQIHMLLWPTVAALMLRRPAVHAWVTRWMRPAWVFLFTAAAGAAAWKHSPERLVTVLSWMFTIWVVATMLHPASWSTRVLEWRPLRFLGRISYSLYLWHVLFFSAHLHAALVSSRVLEQLSAPGWKYVSALLAALASYFLIERPFIRLGHRLAAPATAGHKDLANIPVLTATR
jgi:peptidoglycan/LPS O-acetylase OafA/YrhL